MTDGPISLGELATWPVTRLNGVGDKKAEGLGSLGVTSMLDLLTYYPRRYVDRSREARIRDLVVGEEAMVLVTVERTSSRRTCGRPPKVLVTADVRDDSGTLRVTFFNQAWRERQLTPGLTVALFGKVDLYSGRKQMTNPVVDLIGNRTGRIVPIYPQSEKARLSTWEIGDWVAELLRRAAPRGPGRPGARLGARPLRPGEPPRGLRRCPHARLDGPPGGGPAPARPRRAAAGAARPRPAQAPPRAHDAGPGARHRRPAARRVRRPPAVRPDRRPAGGDRRDRRSTWPRHTRCTACCRATSARGRPSWRCGRCSPPCRVDSRARSWRRPRCWPSSTPWASAPCSTGSRCPMPAPRCSGPDPCGSSC